MATEIIVALIGCAGSAAGAFCGILVNTKLTTYRLEQLEKKVDKHNNFAERMPVVEEKMKAYEHRIEDLELAEKENRRLEHEN